MKQFNNFKQAFNWVEDVVKKASEKSIEDVTRQVFKDSMKYTYIDTQAMYDSAEASDFKKGIVLVKAPQVRWLYYTTGITPHKNKSAVPLWFERTKIEHINDYIKIVIGKINQQKKG